MALSSGPPPSGVSVIRISGPDASAVAVAFGATDLPPRKASLRTLYGPDDGEPIDRALCLFFPAPRSATGEDVVEFQCHGSPAVIDRVLSEAVAHSGVRAAEPGEFTLRSVLSGRMGLADAEALADLIDARTEAERRRALRLSEGALTARLGDWKDRLVSALALCEAHLDFTDEGDVPDGGPAVDDALEPLREEIAKTLLGSRDAEKLTDGFRIVLAGPPNAGKSSLINAVAGRAVALVSEEAGTTRDVVTVTVDLGGYRVILADTAGVRDGASGIEALGIDRTLVELSGADLIVEVQSPDTTPLSLRHRDIVVAHKADLGASPEADHATSISDTASIERFVRSLAARVASGMSSSEAALVTRARQRSALSAIDDALGEALSTAHLELKAEALRTACHAMGRLTGEIDVEDILDDVFGRFCIGK
ncbi:MAG: tRNA uridine-5-carboxymethylaminomethyl(34) synthesis GTPase MnmE [Pseudomonadota bacterium]